VAEESMDIIIEMDGSICVPFFPVSFSEFVIDHLYDDEERERVKRYESMNVLPNHVFCG